MEGSELKIFDTLLTATVKTNRSGHGFISVENRLGENDVLFLKRDLRDPLVVLPLDVLRLLIKNFLQQTEEDEISEVQNLRTKKV